MARIEMRHGGMEAGCASASRRVLMAGVPVALVVGAIAGILGARTWGMPRESQDTTRPAVCTHEAEVPRPGSPQVPEKAPVLTMERKEDTSEITRLRKRIADLEAMLPHDPTKEDRLAVAREMLGYVRERKNDASALAKLVQCFSKLHPDMCGFFLEHATDPDIDPKDRPMVVGLALGCGGPDAAAYLNARFNDPSIEPRELRTLVATLSSGEMELFSIERIPVTGPLADTAARWVTSPEAVQRAGGAGLLGGIDTVESRTTLRHLAETDLDNEVRFSAITALGTVGDRDTLAWLDTLRIPAENRWLTRGVEATRKKLKARFR